MNGHISIVFGVNGAGKTFYSKTKEKENEKYLVLNSEISKWYDEETKKLSEFNYKSKEFNKRKNKYFTTLFSKDSSLLSIKGSKLNVKKLKKIARNLDFIKIEQLIAFFKENKEEINEFQEENKTNEFFQIANDYFKILLDEQLLNDLQKIASKQELKELIIIYNLFKKDEKIKYDFKVDKILTYLSNIENEREKIYQDIKNNELESFLEYYDILIKYVDLEDASPIKDTLIFGFKSWIVSSKEFGKILKIDNEIKKIEKSSFKFKDNWSEKEIKVSENRLELEIDLSENKFSAGQKATKVLNIISKSLQGEKNKRTIILDDFFEKLDSKNRQNCMDVLIKNDKNKFEVLSHNTDDMVFFSEYVKYNNIQIEKKYVKIDENKNPSLIKMEQLFLTMGELCGAMQNYDTSIKELIEKDNGWIYYFIIIFSRYLSKNGAIKVINEQNNIKDNFFSQVFNFSSENVFHYNPKIDKNKIKKYFLIDDLKNDEDYDSIDFLQFLHKKIDEKYKANKYSNISKDKFLDFISKIIIYLKEEKVFYTNYTSSNKLKNLAQPKSAKFYKNYWKNHTKKKERNKTLHSIDHNLLEFIDLE